MNIFNSANEIRTDFPQFHLFLLITRMAAKVPRAHGSPLIFGNAQIRPFIPSKSSTFRLFSWEISKIHFTFGQYLSMQCSACNRISNIEVLGSGLPAEQSCRHSARTCGNWEPIIGKALYSTIHGLMTLGCPKLRSP
jgi:hypothetical protein